MELNKIYLGDAYELIKSLPDNSIDLVVIDPPYEYTTGGKNNYVSDRPYHKQYYGVAEYKTDSMTNRKVKSRNEIKHLSYGVNYSVLDDFLRVMRSINIYVFCSKHMIPTLLNYFIEKDCIFEIMFWGKTNPLPTANNTYLNDVEYLLYFREKGVKVGGTYETKSKFYISGTNITDKDEYDHPTIKPLKLVKNIIENSSQKGDVVLDTFMGSGTTAVACKELGRNFIGFEIDPTYHQIANDRVNGMSQIDRRKKEKGMIDIWDFMGEES